ncbi:hypothetical protein ACRAWD_12865 [Caulobacter segnis]
MADRIGVINQRRDHPGRGQDRPDAQAGQKQLTCICASRWRPSRRAWRTSGQPGQRGR